MLKFKYHYLTNSLFIQKQEYQWNQISAENQFLGNFQANGFTLEPQNHWISFQVKENRLQVFYKLPVEPSEELNTNDGFWSPEKFTYFKKYLAKEEEVIFTFTPQDEIEKVNGKWVKKGAKHA